MTQSNQKLTKKEEDILRVLWDADHPLTTSEICKYGEEMGINLKLNSVQVMITRLIKLGYIKVEGITLINTVYARAFAPAMTADEYIAARFSQEMESVKPARTSSLVAHLLKNGDVSNEELDELLKLIQELK